MGSKEYLVMFAVSVFIGVASFALSTFYLMKGSDFVVAGVIWLVGGIGWTTHAAPGWYRLWQRSRY